MPVSSCCLSNLAPYPTPDDTDTGPFSTGHVYSWKRVMTSWKRRNPLGCLLAAEQGGNGGQTRDHLSGFGSGRLKLHVHCFPWRCIDPETHSRLPARGMQPRHAAGSSRASPPSPFRRERAIQGGGPSLCWQASTKRMQAAVWHVQRPPLDTYYTGIKARHLHPQAPTCSASTRGQSLSGAVVARNAGRRIP